MDKDTIHKLLDQMNERIDSIQEHVSRIQHALSVQQQRNDEALRQLREERERGDNN